MISILNELYVPLKSKDHNGIWTIDGISKIGKVTIHWWCFIENCGLKKNLTSEIIQEIVRNCIELIYEDDYGTGRYKNANNLLLNIGRFEEQLRHYVSDSIVHQYGQEKIRISGVGLYSVKFG